MDHLTGLIKLNTILTTVTFVLNTVNVKLAVIFGSLSVGIPYGQFDTFQVIYNGCVIILALVTCAMFVTSIRLYRFVKEYIYTSEQVYGAENE